MGLVCMSVQSVAKPSLRVQSWRGTSWYTQERNLSSAHLRAVANGSRWTLTCAHMCVFTLETARMCAPLMAATKNLPSRLTWSLTSSHMPKPKTTSESVLNPAYDDVTEKWLFLKLFDIHMEVWTRNSWEPPTPSGILPYFGATWMEQLWTLLVKMLINGSAPKNLFIP